MDLVVLVGAVSNVENDRRTKLFPHIWLFYKTSGCIFGREQVIFYIAYVYKVRITSQDKRFFLTLFYIWGIDS